jgi:hypothetical protein
MIALSCSLNVSIETYRRIFSPSPDANTVDFRAGNWDQSLMNLGFTDTDNMNQDFFTFCQEPDPLHQNNVFQQLVANSNAEATEFFDGSAFGGGGSTFGGLGVAGIGSLGGIGDESEGIEAGQILQALSAAEETRSGR